MPFFDLDRMDTKTIALIEASLPLSLEPIVAEIGLKKTLALVEEYGGTDFVPPKAPDGPGKQLFAEIERVIGFDATLKLSKLFNGDRLSVPKCQEAKNAYRNARMVQDYDTLTKQMSGTKAVHSLAKQHDLSHRHVEMIINGKCVPRPPKRPCKVVRGSAGVSAAHTPAAPTQSPAGRSIHGCPTAWR